MKKLIPTIFIVALFSFAMIRPVVAGPGDTTVIRTFRYDTNMRQGMFNFPSDTTKTYEKILMLYSMRCKDGLVSNSQNTNQGCGEWDYNCYTYVIDSAQTDSLRSRHDSHIISNYGGNHFNYTLTPVYLYTRYLQQSVVYDMILSETSATVGNGTASLIHPFNTGEHAGRTLYLWTAAELSAAGLSPGNITGMRLDVLFPGSTVANLRIGIKATTQGILDAYNPETAGFTEVYFLDTPVSGTGLKQFNFYTPFNWDGVSNLLVSFSYTNPDFGTTTQVAGQDAGAVMGLTDFEHDSYLCFNGSAQAIKLNPSFFDAITDKITIAFWCYGDSTKLPANTTFLEGVDQNNQRAVNIHMPWSNSRIYWDCGNDGGNYDRIDQAATTEEIMGKWNFWVFTKDAIAGTMKIYKNGHLWASETGKTRLIDIKQWFVGRDASGSLSYWGNMDELSIWNKDLDSAAISMIMNKDITPSHPDYNNLLVYYPLNEGSGDTAQDWGPHAYSSRIINPGWRNHRPDGYFRNFNEENFRPNTSFVQGAYVMSIDSIAVMDSTLMIPSSVISFEVSNNNLITLDTIYVWPAAYTYITDPYGVILDSIAIPVHDSIAISQLTYYQFRPMRVELINFITPYGIALNLNGLIGKTWIFDVTDYATVLRGRKFMAMSDGIYQEDNDITFVYYEGTPPRKVMSLQSIWPGGSWVSPSYNDIYNDNYFEARTLHPYPGAVQFKLRSAISGHGQEGEFIPRMHTLTLNDTVKFTYQVWKHCANNPIYPQGGTWVYERAGWCPGAVVDTHEFEITSLLQPGQDFKLDYSLPYVLNPGSSNYRVNNQLVSYGPASFSTDAMLEYVKQPSDRVEFARFNPLCNQPVVGIKNTGSNVLTSLEIVYGRKGGNLLTYEWTGSLGFLNSAEITLPMPDWNSSSSNQFIAYVKNPNSMVDQYPYNDTVTSKFTVTPAYPNKLMFELKTNNYPWENYCVLLNSNGDTILYKNALSANTLYRDTLDLPDDCYTFRLFDSGDDGLSFWANTAQGSGYMRIKSSVSNVIYKTFGSDFGDNIYHQFKVDQSLAIEDVASEELHHLDVYPNPAKELLTVSFDIPAGSSALITLTSITGQILQQQPLKSSQPQDVAILDVSDLKDGIYLVTLQSGKVKRVKRVVVLR